MKKFLLLAIILLPFNIYANENPEKFIEGLADNVIKIVTDKDLSDSEKEEKLNIIFVEVVDVDWIGKFVLGKYWRRATPEQKEEFLKNYRLFLQKTYVSNFKKYEGEKVEIKKSRKDGDNDYLIETSIARSNGKNLDVNYRIHNTEKGQKIFDVQIEGVSLLNTQRTEFNSVIAQNGLDNFIEKMKYRVTKL